MKQLLGFMCLTMTIALPISAKPLKEATVTIDAFQFMPATITVKKGARVTFTNKDNTPHTATPDTKGFVGTGRLANKDRQTVVFNKLGEHPFHCDIHPSMMGKVVVVK